MFSFWERSAHILDSYTGPLFAKRKAGNPKNVASVWCFHICSLAEFFMSQSPYYIIVQTHTHTQKRPNFLLPLDSRDTSLLRARRTWANVCLFSCAQRSRKDQQKALQNRDGDEGYKGPFFFLFFFLFWQFFEIGELAIDRSSIHKRGRVFF